jgi:NAD(P)-dependent dehydrogenase (short-subunit alcohol dehydrogenase family)
MNDHVAVVTGAASGLGLELALHLVSKDRIVVGVSRRPPTEERWRQAASSGKAYFFPGDVSNPATAKGAFDLAFQIGRPDLVVNCAGQGVFGPAGSFTRADVDAALAANLIGTILFSEMAFALFKSQGGTIVNVLSTAAQVARANESLYCASKWGAKGYTESLRLEAKGTPVRVVAAYPGGMRTRFWQEATGQKVDASKFMSPAEVARTLVTVLEESESAYVSDIVINRK